MQYTENYSLREPQAAETASYQDINYNTRRIDGIMADNRQISVAMYVSGNTYNTGDLVGYENPSTHHIKVYRCLVDNVTGVWDSTKWTLTNLAAEIIDAKQSGGTEVIANPTGTAAGTLNTVKIDDVIYEVGGDSANQNIADAFSELQTYAVGDYCIYESILYKCTTVISTAGAWDSTKWTPCVVTDEMGSGGGGGSSTLAGLSDVNISSPIQGQMLKYDGTNWINGNNNINGYLIPPDFQGMSYCYVANGSTFIQYTPNIYYNNIFPVKANHTYYLFIGDVVSNRCRILFISGKSINDFSPYLNTPAQEQTTIFTGTLITPNNDDTSRLQYRYYYTPTTDGMIAMTTSNDGTVAPAYCVDIDGIPSSAIVDESYTYYNGYLLPTLPVFEGYDYIWIRKNPSTNTYDALYAPSQWYCSPSQNPTLNSWHLTYDGISQYMYKYYTCPLTDANKWTEKTGTSYTTFGTDNGRDLIWSNAPILNTNKNDIVIYGGASVKHIIANDSARHAYATVEQPVGTFLGKPLYEIVLTGTFTSATQVSGSLYSGYFDITALGNVDNVFVDISHSYFEVSNNERGFIGGYSEVDNDRLLLITNGTQSNVNATITVQYTKSSS